LNPRLTLALVATVGACAPAAPRTAAPSAAAPAVPVTQLERWLTAYAADSMEGREAGERGNERATAWLAAEAQRIGLEPAGENGSYFQVLPLRRLMVADGSAIEVDGTRLTPDRDLLVLGTFPMLRVGGTLQGEGIPVVYGGRLGDKAAGLTAEQVRGKLVVFDAPLGPTGKPMWQFWNALDRGLLSGSRGALVTTLGQTPPQVVEMVRKPTAMPEGGATTPVEAPFVAAIDERAAQALLGAAPSSLAPGAAGRTVRANVRVEARPSAAQARNVVALIRGSDPALRAEYVAIGAHNDHVGMSDTPLDHDSLWAHNRVVRPLGAEGDDRAPTPQEQLRIQAIRDSLRALRAPRRDSVYNGADDDGSGSIAVLAIAEALAKAKARPKRSLLFVWHTGEEKGLWGSDWFTEHPTVSRDAIVAQLNMDMVGRGKPTDSTGTSMGGPGQLQLIGSRRLSTQLGDLVETANRDGRHGFTFDYALDADGHPANIYCRSDHYMYARFGIPVVFFTTGVHQDYHMLTDEAQYIDYAKMARVSGLVTDIALRLANAPARPVVDKPKPDPKAECRQ
jgi:hypothetical protein